MHTLKQLPFHFRTVVFWGEWRIFLCVVHQVLKCAFFLEKKIPLVKTNVLYYPSSGGILLIDLSKSLQCMHNLCGFLESTRNTFASGALPEHFDFCTLSWEFLTPLFLSWATRSDYWQLKFEFWAAGLFLFWLLVGCTGLFNLYHSKKYLKQSRRTKKMTPKGAVCQTQFHHSIFIPLISFKSAINCNLHMGFAGLGLYSLNLRAAAGVNEHISLIQADLCCK